MPLNLTTLLQVLILALGIYLLLAFLRSTRGSGLVRGLGLTLIVGVYGLWGMADALEWFELKLVIQGVLGFAFVILAIVFQPELRRGISSLGDNPLLGRLLRTQRADVVSEVVAATISMAKKKQGALIAFERKTPLDTYVEGGVKLDADANRYLLESVFHHGNVLHDGAVIIRGDRVVAAACLFPLTENIEISKSTGTRHRAALGLTEDSDAVTVAVSEETGRISICKRGKMDRNVSRKSLEDLLQQRLGMVSGATPEEEDTEDGRPRRSFIAGLFSQHLGQKLAALVLGALVFYGAHQDLRFEREKVFSIGTSTSESARARPGELIVVLEEGWRLDTPPVSCQVSFEGTRDQLDVMALMGGIVRVREDQRAIKIEDVEWVPALDPGVDPYWRDGADIPIQVIGLDEGVVALTKDMFTVVTDGLDHRREALVDQLTFHPAKVTVRGPKQALQDLNLRFADVVLDHEQTYDVERSIALSRELFEAGIELMDQVFVEFPIVLREDPIGTVQMVISLQQFEDLENPHEFLAPSTPAEFEIYGRGLLGGDDSDETRIAVRNFVKDNLRAFIIVDDIQTGSLFGHVRQFGLEGWREKLSEQIDDLPPEADLRVELVSDSEITLSK